MATEALKILAIDDTPDNLITLKAVVRDALPGAAVVTALSGPQGIALARAVDPDVILLDIVMPEMDGYAVCRALKADDRLRQIPVVFLTALRADRESRLQALEAGAEAFLAKPLDEVELIAQIRAMAKIKAANQMQRLEREQLAELVAERTRELEQELTERKRAEAALREKDEFLRNLLEHAPVSIYVTATDRRLRLVNRRWEEDTGKLRAQVQGCSLDQVFPPETARKLDADNQSVIETGDSMAFEEALGTQHFFTVKFPLHDAFGHVEAVGGISVDITERKHTEEALRESEERFRALIEHSHDALTLLTADGTVLYDSPSIERVLGYSPTERIGRKVFEFAHPEEREGMAHGFAKFAQQMGAVTLSGVRFIHKDGTPRWIEGVRTNLLHEPIIRAVVVNYRDITERKRAEVALRETLADLERSNADLERFAYVASHDLQEPLRMVASYVQLLSMRYQGQLDADADEFIGYALDGATRMQQLILDLLEYSRVGTRGAPLQPTDANRACQTALQNLELAIVEHDATVVCDPLPTVLADDMQLAQLFQNLIGNAIKFRGAAPPQVHISARQTSKVAAKVWEFAVRDDGIGIDPAYFERIFVIFQRLHTREAYAGTGIGLAICKKIVERHGGRIWVESQVGQGATFYFTLPAAT